MGLDIDIDLEVMTTSFFRGTTKRMENPHAATFAFVLDNFQCYRRKIKITPKDRPVQWIWELVGVTPLLDGEGRG